MASKKKIRTNSFIEKLKKVNLVKEPEDRHYVSDFAKKMLREE